MTLSASPQCVSSDTCPKDLSSLRFDRTGINGYFLFTVTDKHYRNQALKDRLIGQMMMFRPYLDYHFKCTKAFTHYRMRYCHDNLVQIANRSKGEVKVVRCLITLFLFYLFIYLNSFF